MTREADKLDQVLAKLEKIEERISSLDLKFEGVKNTVNVVALALLAPSTDGGRPRRRISIS